MTFSTGTQLWTDFENSFTAELENSYELSATKYNTFRRLLKISLHYCVNATALPLLDNKVVNSII